MSRQRMIVDLARSCFGGAKSDILAGAGDDDCAIVVHGSSKLLVSSDFRNYRRHMEVHDPLDPEEVGRFVVRQNVADIFGSGGMPRWFMLSIALPEKMALIDVERLFHAVKSECDRFEMTVVGGDTKQADTLIICGTILGEVERDPWIISGASPGQDVWISGHLGGVMSSVCILENCTEKALREKALSVLRDADLPLTKMKEAIARLTIRCATDISDGLGMSLHSIMRGSQVGMIIDCATLPLHPLARTAARIFQMPPEQFAFGYGGDFQFVLVASEAWRAALYQLGFIRVGETTLPGRNELINWSGKFSQIPDFGFEDFQPGKPSDRFFSYFGRVAYGAPVHQSLANLDD
jgi:thiamine-monophosphate kinase